MKKSELEPASVQLTRGPDKAAGNASQPREAAARDAQLPHERDQHPDSQAAPEAPNQEVGEQAFLDVSHGLVDTDDNLRASSAEHGKSQPARPSVPASQQRHPREAHPREATDKP